ncbi:unnamed protein product [Paramecium octaurelia]|uniref:Uncharacterized protein n=1 Tax=Paramecium octaurelia TaxID=43137 RepID=A0A8S1VER0_PAROT|nr:unnamed protein product [Paramecium octaurelia]
MIQNKTTSCGTFIIQLNYERISLGSGENYYKNEYINLNFYLYFKQLQNRLPQQQYFRYASKIIKVELTTIMSIICLNKFVVKIKKNDIKFNLK